jgi:hypothetical protein
MITTWTIRTIEQGVSKVLQYVHYKSLNKLVIREIDNSGIPIDIVKTIHYI